MKVHYLIFVNPSLKGGSKSVPPTGNSQISPTFLSKSSLYYSKSALPVINIITNLTFILFLWLLWIKLFRIFTYCQTHALHLLDFYLLSHFISYFLYSLNALYMPFLILFLCFYLLFHQFFNVQSLKIQFLILLFNFQDFWYIFCKLFLLFYTTQPRRQE